MSVPCEEIRPELEALLGALAEGSLDPAQRRRLGEILREHPEARQVYLDYCQMHALLYSAHGVLHAMSLGTRKRGLRRGLAALAAAILGLGILGLLFLRASSGIAGSVASVQGVAWLVRGETRIQVPESCELRDGDRVLTGRGGQSALQMKDGTKLRLLEEADLSLRRIGGQARLEVKAGLVECDVAPQPPGRPFVLSAPHAELTVLGTSFDVAAGWNETRVFMRSGRVELSSEGRRVALRAGELGTANPSEVLCWVPVCSLDFSRLTSLPRELEAVFCPSEILQSASRTVEAAPEKLHFVPGGLVPGPLPGTKPKHGLVVARWREEVGEDLVIEADVKGGERWSLGFSVSGDSFEGYRIIFAAVEGYPNGIAVDTLHPAECIVLAVDPRPIHYNRDQTLRVERRGSRIRVWVDRELRIDTEISHPLSERRRRTFALSNFGAPPVVERLRVWKPAAP